MKQDIKKRWVEALRSGKYQQGQGGLQDAGGKFCCLGVLCDLAVQEEVIHVGQRSPSGEWVAYDGRSGVLPSSVAAWAGLDSSDPSVVPFGGTTLTDLNDSMNYTFGQIADLIEEYL